MDEPSPKSAPKETVDAPSSVAEESAVARGSQVIKISPERSARTEHSVVEGLPDTKTERIASMRRELADLQQHLIDAQQRVATELQGRVEDAERLEALETFVQEHELNSQKEATRVGELETEIAGLRSQLSTATATTNELRRDIAARDARIEEALGEAKTLLAARDAVLATRTTERETEQATRSRLERELEDHRKQHHDVTEQLELQFTSLRDAKALLATMTAELTATTSERDVLKRELEPARREIDAARTKLSDVANQLVRLGQDLGDGGVIAAKRPQPPPPPQPRPAAPTPPVVETIVMTEEAKPASRIGSALFMLGGVIVGCAVTVVIMKWSSSSRADDQTATPSTLVAAPVVTEHVQPSTSGLPAPASDAVTAQPKQDSRPAITAPPATTNTTDGVIVLPASAAGHRVYVDGRVVEVKNSRASVPCGGHEVRIGSSGTARKFDIVCGGETELPDDK